VTNAPASGPAEDPVVAAIDCGTNSTRLLVSRGGKEALAREMTITRMGHGVDRTGQLDSEAIERVLTCLRNYRTIMDELHVSKIRMTATSAARDAKNSATFFDAAEEIIGVRPELLSGEEEGQLSFQGATADLDPADGPFLVFDIGGGSTEFAFGTEQCEQAVSTDMGCVRFTEKYIEHDPPRPEELSACVTVAGLFLDDVDRAIPAARHARTFVGLAGTVSATAAIEIGLPEYDRDALHHFRLTHAAVEDVFRTVATESAEDRSFNPGLEADRVEVIVAGSSILAKIMRHFAIDEILVSEADILDGLIHSLLS